MRVISGIYRGRKIASPLNNAIRPTTDKVKEAIFSIVQSEIRGATVIDLFSGTGALAIEAISRGAEKVYMCDNTPASLDLIKQNLSFVKRESYDLYKGDYVDCIRRFVSKGEKADVIILDPPYHKGIPRKALECIQKYDALAEDGIIIVERKETDALVKDVFTLISTRQYGETCIDVYKNYKKCAVTGTFDPFTNGHAYVVDKAFEEFDFVHVVMLVNENKQTTYSVETRKDIIKISLNEYKKRIKIDFFEGLAIDYCKENGIEYIYRGYRNDSDLAYEKEMAEWNETHGNVKTILVEAKDSISSSEVKRKYNEGISVDDDMHEDAIRYLGRK